MKTVPNAVSNSLGAVDALRKNVAPGAPDNVRFHCEPTAGSCVFVVRDIVPCAEAAGPPSSTAIEATSHPAGTKGRGRRAGECDTVECLQFPVVFP